MYSNVQFRQAFYWLKNKVKLQRLKGILKVVIGRNNGVFLLIGCSYSRVPLWLFTNQSARDINVILILYQLTIFVCSLKLNRTLWSITIRSEGQHLKFIFCVFMKPSDIFSPSCSMINL